MQDDDTNDTDDASTTDEATATEAVDLSSPPSTHKVLGSLTAHDGVGLLGRNDAGSGTPVGVRGEAAGGFGIETPDDARIGGNLDSTSGHVLAVDGVPTFRVGVLRDDYDGRQAGANVVGGYPRNDDADHAGVTISGGGAGGRETVHGQRRPRSNLGYGDYATVGGGRSNWAERAATVAGGRRNTARGTASAVGGGNRNLADGPGATVAGGNANRAWSEDSSIGGGTSNVVTGTEATIAGGERNAARTTNASVGGGYLNDARGQFSTIAGGAVNRTGASGTNTGFYAAVPGGRRNVATGTYGFAAGFGAEATHEGAYVWSDATSGTVTSATGNTYLVRATNGVGINKELPAATLDVAGGNWDLSTTEGDVRIGNDDHRLKMGVATAGGGAGIAHVRAQSTNIDKLNLGTGTDDVVTIETDRDGITIDAVYPATDGRYELGYPGQRWNAVYAVDGTINTSDARLKTNVTDLTDGLERVESLRPVRYEWVEDGPTTGDGDRGARLGLIAQEVADVVPEAVVDPGDDGYLGLRYSTLVPVLVDAVQTQRATIDEAENRIDDLRERLDDRDDRIRRQNDRIDALERENEAVREELASLRSAVEAVAGSGSVSPADD